MEYCKGRITKLLVDYFGNDFRRINHALEVLKYSEQIMENVPDCDREIVKEADRIVNKLGSD